MFFFIPSKKDEKIHLSRFKTRNNKEEFGDEEEEEMENEKQINREEKLDEIIDDIELDNLDNKEE